MFKFKDIGGVPSNPPTGYVGIYCNAGVLYWIDENGALSSMASGAGDIKADGTIPLTADWDVGGFSLTALQFHSDVAIGTAPFTVVSTTVVTNLNADKLDGADLIDEDNMASDSDVHVPTQQSVKAYVDSTVTGGVAYKGGYAADTNTPDLDTAPSGVTKGDMYTVTAAGTFFTTDVEIGDVLIAEADSAATEAEWTIVQGNIDYTAAQIKTLYESNGDTNEFSDAEQTKLAGIDANASVKSNLSATAAPTATDDSGSGYGVGSKWVDVTNDLIYFCLDATATAAVWQAVGSGSGGGMTVTAVKTANYTASANEVVPVDSSGGAFTVTLPLSPSTQDRVIIVDVGKSCGTNTVTIARNGNTIDGNASDFGIDQDSGRVDAYFDGTSDWETHLIGMASPDTTKYVGVNNQTGTTYGFVLLDAGKLVVANNAAASTYTIPANASVAYDIGTKIDVFNKGAGTVTIAITTDTLTTTNNNCAQYKAVSLIKIATTEWIVVGGS